MPLEAYLASFHVQYIFLQTQYYKPRIHYTSLNDGGCTELSEWRGRLRVRHLATVAGVQQQGDTVKHPAKACGSSMKSDERTAITAAIAASAAGHTTGNYYCSLHIIYISS